jgi:hypothetical protein
MEKAARKKPKRKSPKFSGQKQSERFIEAARKLGIEEPGERFEHSIRKVIRAKNASKP